MGKGRTRKRERELKWNKTGNSGLEEPNKQLVKEEFDNWLNKDKSHILLAAYFH